MNIYGPRHCQLCHLETLLSNSWSLTSTPLVERYLQKCRTITNICCESISPRSFRNNVGDDNFVGGNLTGGRLQFISDLGDVRLSCLDILWFSREIAATYRITVAYAEFHDNNSGFTVHRNMVIDAVGAFREDGRDGIFQCRTS
jgi:hypothetical protein